MLYAADKMVKYLGMAMMSTALVANAHYRPAVRHHEHHQQRVAKADNDAVQHLQAMLQPDGYEKAASTPQHLLKQIGNAATSQGQGAESTAQAAQSTTDQGASSTASQEADVLAEIMGNATAAQERQNANISDADDALRQMMQMMGMGNATAPQQQDASSTVSQGQAAQSTTDQGASSSASQGPQSAENSAQGAQAAQSTTDQGASSTASQETAQNDATAAQERQNANSSAADDALAQMMEMMGMANATAPQQQDASSTVSQGQDAKSSDQDNKSDDAVAQLMEMMGMANATAPQQQDADGSDKVAPSTASQDNKSESAQDKFTENATAQQAQDDQGKAADASSLSSVAAPPSVSNNAEQSIAEIIQSLLAAEMNPEQLAKLLNEYVATDVTVKQINAALHRLSPHEMRLVAQHYRSEPNPKFSELVGNFMSALGSSNAN